MGIIKPETKKYIEKIALFCIYSLLVANVIFLKDNPIAALSAFFGITYTFLAGKGKPECYLFGVSGSALYGFLSFQNALWGNLILYVCYYIPMQITGFIKWKSHLKNGQNEVVKISLPRKEWAITLGITTIIAIVMIILLYFFKGNNPISDGITTIFSITGMYLTVRRAIEQWHIWAIVNGLSAFMWGVIAFSGVRVYSTVFMWCIYFVLAIYFYVVWQNELKQC